MPEEGVRAVVPDARMGEGEQRRAVAVYESDGKVGIADLPVTACR
ncbi:hypothetical protein [Ferribacterium limneticum]|nr:hypothetical protein [Ferribacterium limneticum]